MIERTADEKARLADGTAIVVREHGVETVVPTSSFPAYTLEEMQPYRRPRGVKISRALAREKGLIP